MYKTVDEWLWGWMVWLSVSQEGERVDWRAPPSLLSPPLTAPPWCCRQGGNVRMNGWMFLMNGWMIVWMDECLYEWMNVRMNGSMFVWMGQCSYEWVNVRMNGWMSNNIIKHFEWPLVMKALYKCSPFVDDWMNGWLPGGSSEIHAFYANFLC